VQQTKLASHQLLGTR